MYFKRLARWVVIVAALLLASVVQVLHIYAPLVRVYQSDSSAFLTQVKFTREGESQNLMNRLGIKTLRHDANPNDRNIFDEASARRYPLPELMVTQNGAKVIKAKQQTARRAVAPSASKAGQLKFTPNKAGNHYAPVEKSGQTGAGTTPAADQATPRTDSNSRIAHEQLLEKARKGGIDIYFAGDSITRRWGTSDEQYKAYLMNWRQNFFGWNAANFGWGGDTTQNILWRLKNGELDNVNPKIIVLMAGTNNVGKLSPESKDDPRVADITRGIKAILNVCRQKAPSATIVIMGITPRNDNMAVMPIINQINANIAKFADGKKVRYLNINDRLADKEGKLFEGITNRDGLHLDVKGYQVWADALKPIFTKLLGPPTKEDYAPPPTGDPSARKPPTN